VHGRYNKKGVLRPVNCNNGLLKEKNGLEPSFRELRLSLAKTDMINYYDKFCLLIPRMAGFKAG